PWTQPGFTIGRMNSDNACSSRGVAGGQAWDSILVGDDGFADGTGRAPNSLYTGGLDAWMSCGHRGARVQPGAQAVRHMRQGDAAGARGQASGDPGYRARQVRAPGFRLRAAPPVP